MKQLPSLIVIGIGVLFGTYPACSGSRIERPVYMEGGSFLMGDQFGEHNHYEKPAHEVELSDYHPRIFDKLQDINNEPHYSQTWKVHEIAKDFILLDVWEYPILADKSKDQDFLFFIKMIHQPHPDKINKSVSINSRAARLLISLRMILGKIFRLDKNINTLPIPGCRESSVKERLSMEDRKNSIKLSELGITRGNNGTWRIVYLYENEMLAELSIDVVHALMHLGWVHKYENFFTARLAVYAKPRGKIGKLYMKLIMPFRRAVIYPALMEDMKNLWEFNNKKIQNKE